MNTFTSFALKYNIGVINKQHRFIPIKDLNNNGILIFLGTNPAPLIKIKKEKRAEISAVFIIYTESIGTPRS